jgi:hypothetical protein
LRFLGLSHQVYISFSISAFKVPADRVISQWQKGYSAAHNLCVVLGLGLISTMRI